MGIITDIQMDIDNLLIITITVDFSENRIVTLNRMNEQCQITHNGTNLNCIRSQFPLRAENQGSTLHAFNGVTAQEIQMIISQKHQDYAYWSIDQVTDIYIHNLENLVGFSSWKNAENKWDNIWATTWIGDT